jgi:uncharacterized cupredoxin-like copper-binding protein
VLVIVLTIVASACSSESNAETTTSTMADDMDMGGEHAEYPFGEPMEAGAADRTIEITANDDFSFSPANVIVEAGETVTFKVTNGGAIPHDFTLGDAEMQDEHEAEMAEMGGNMAMHDEPNVFSLEPGETKEMTWHMKASGPIIFGCHQPGHYVAGMKGTIVINS